MGEEQAFELIARNWSKFLSTKALYLKPENGFISVIYNERYSGYFVGCAKGESYVSRINGLGMMLKIGVTKNDSTLFFKGKDEIIELTNQDCILRDVSVSNDRNEPIIKASFDQQGYEVLFYPEDNACTSFSFMPGTQDGLPTFSLDIMKNAHNENYHRLSISCKPHGETYFELSFYEERLEHGKVVQQALYSPAIFEGKYAKETLAFVCRYPAVAQHLCTCYDELYKRVGIMIAGEIPTIFDVCKEQSLEKANYLSLLLPTRMQELKSHGLE